MKRILAIALFLLMVIACNRTDNTFLITNDNVGVLRKNTPIAKLDSIYAKDSLVNTTFEGELRYASTERIIIFEKGGKELLEITPAVNSDNEKVVESVQILDSRFITEQGISLASTYKDIKKLYKDFDIQQTLSSILITIPNRNYYFTINKSDVKSKNFGLSSEITKNDIEEDAKLSRIVITWDL